LRRVRVMPLSFFPSPSFLPSFPRPFFPVSFPHSAVLAFSMPSNVLSSGRDGTYTAPPATAPQGFEQIIKVYKSSADVTVCQ
jgi:hypothetical protein